MNYEAAPPTSGDKRQTRRRHGQSSGSNRPLHIVIIGDDPFDPKGFTRVVIASKWPRTTIASFASIEAALDPRSAGVCPESADEMLLDDRLGQGISAEDKIPRLFAAHKARPIVVLTGSNAKGRAIEIIRLGAAQFQVKDQFTQSGSRTLLLLARSSRSTALRRTPT